MSMAKSNLERFIATLLLVGSQVSCADQRPAERVRAASVDTVQSTQIVLLGTGTPNADPYRFGPSVAIVVNGTPYLIDCGPGVVRRAAAAYLLGNAALEIANLKHLFVTHLHSDHTIGYPDLILSPWVLGRDAPLLVYGPEGIGSMTDHLLQAYREDIRVRLEGLEPANTVGYKVDVHEIKPGIIHRDENVTVRAFPVKHGSWAHAFGFRFETADRTIVISGDTAPCPSLIENAKGCDVLIHEVYSLAGFKGRPSDWKQYHSSFHTSTEELARIANQVKPGLLILYHQLTWGAANEKQLVEEITRLYKGRVVSGSDLDVY